MNYELLHGDCLDILKTLPDGSVDCVITDPPYGIGESRAKVVSRGKLATPIDYGDFGWDTERLDRVYIDEMRRVSAAQVIFGGNYYADLLPPSSSWIVWDKNNSGDFADCELAWTSHKKAVRKFKWTWNGFIKEKPEQRFHPTQKPLALMVWVIENYTRPGDLIADFFFGSGTTAVACVKTGRNFIGCEIDPTYYAIAQRRIEDAAAQPMLLEVTP